MDPDRDRIKRIRVKVDSLDFTKEESKETEGRTLGTRN